MTDAWIVSQKQGPSGAGRDDGSFKCAICDKRYSGATPDYFVGTKEGHDFHYACLKLIVENGGKPKCPICDEPIGFASLAKRIEAMEEKRLTIPRLQQQRSANEGMKNLKFVVVGDSGVGKTSLLRSYVCGTFDQKSRATLGVDVLWKKIQMGDGRVRLNLWDTAGEEKFQAIVPNYFRNAHVILFVYSVMDLRSFQKIGGYWIPFVNRHGPKDALRVLIGNKCEDKQRRQVPRSVAQRFSVNEGMAFFETSAKHSINIEPAIRTAAAEAMEKALLDDWVESSQVNKLQLRDAKKKTKSVDKCC